MQAPPTLDELGQRLDVLSDRFPRITRQYRVPAAILGIIHSGEERYVAAGEWTTAAADRPFPATSLTKLFTSTLVMRLVDQGLVELDRAAVDYVPELSLPSPELGRRLTVRHLLSHTSGLRDGALEAVDGLEPLTDQSIAEYVARSRALVRVPPPGEVYSYSSPGFVVLGRLVELVTGREWPEALREGLLGPLGLTATVHHPEMLAGRGFDASGWSCKGDAPTFSRWLAPAAMMATTIRDLLAFSRLHLDTRGPELRLLLGDDAVRAMREPQIELPDPGLGVAGGLGWRILDRSSDLVGHWALGHGHSTALWVLPARDLAVAVVALDGDAQWMLWDICGPVFGDLMVQDTPRRVRDFDPETAGRVMGIYELPGVRFRVETGDTGLLLTCEERGHGPGQFAAWTGAALTLQPTEVPDAYLARGQNRVRILVHFRRPDSAGRYRYLCVLAHAATRVD